MRKPCASDVGPSEQRVLVTDATHLIVLREERGRDEENSDGPSCSVRQPPAVPRTVPSRPASSPGWPVGATEGGTPGGHAPSPPVTHRPAASSLPRQRARETVGCFPKMEEVEENCSFSEKESVNETTKIALSFKCHKVHQGW